MQQQLARFGKLLQVTMMEDESSEVIIGDMNTVEMYVASVKVVEATIKKALQDGHNKSEVLIMLDSILSNALNLSIRDERRAS